jgi:hypothetical protein
MLVVSVITSLHLIKFNYLSERRRFGGVTPVRGELREPLGLTEHRSSRVKRAVPRVIMRLL